MKWMLYFLLVCLSNSLHAKEWKNFKEYQKETQQEKLSPADWLKSDRIHNSLIWQQANESNLENNHPSQYENIVQRRDFYKWLYLKSEKQGHEVVWFKMTHFISEKLHKMETFPFAIFTNKRIMRYANSCSEVIFNNAFNEANNLFKLKLPLIGKNALAWDKAILYKEQYVWVDEVINTIDTKSIQKIERILQRKFVYRPFIPKEISFDGDLQNNEERFNYALNKLRAYCEKYYN